MLYEEMRVLYYNGSSLGDISLENQDETTNITLATSLTKYIYIGQKSPFTSLFVYLNTANSIAATLDIEYWDGTTWRDVADKLDGTATSGVPFAKSGVIKWYLDDLYAWNKVIDTSKSIAPTELQTLKIYNMYWMRISSSTGLTAGANAKQLAYTFTSTQELNNYDVEISGYYESFATGKTDWIREIITASKLTLMEMKRRGVIMHQGQLIDMDDFTVPASFKALELIYSNLGPSYVERRKLMQEEFAKAINIQRPIVDDNADGEIDGEESKGTPRMLVR